MPRLRRSPGLAHWPCYLAGMRVRDSSMPDRALWESFFEPTEILELLSLPVTGDIVDFGCGYGTFTLTAATLTRGTVYGIDIDPEMVRTTARGAQVAGLSNVCAVERNFVTDGAGLPAGSCSYAMLFNILHAEDAVGLLRQAHEVLHPGGRVAVIHWVSDPGTPRGPPLQIRPTPQECQQWMRAAGFALASPVVQLPPFHYGLVGRRPDP
jgi:SAM-dependent methyltransferase